MSPSFCPAPWLSLYISPSGNIENCCVSNNQLGNTKDNLDIATVVAGPTNLVVQQSMLNGQPVSGCSWCDVSQEPKSRIIKHFYRDGDSLYQPGKFDLKYLDVRWNNTCNLACVYCGPENSSLWESELTGSRKVIKIVKDTKNYLLDYVLDNVETLEEVYFAGGEPTLIKENELILEQLLKRNPKVRIFVNTNLLNNETTIYKNLLGFPNSTWVVSFEAQGREYEYIRYPGVWSVLERNLLNLKQQIPVKQIEFNMLFLSLNALSIWDTIDWLRDHRFEIYSMYLTRINNGTTKDQTPLDVMHMPEEYKQQVLNRCDNSKYTSINGFQTAVAGLHESGNIRELAHFLGVLDNRRNLNSREVFPLIYKYIDNK